MKIREDKIQVRANRVASVIQAPTIKYSACDAMVAAESNLDNTKQALTKQAKREELMKKHS